jgi:hypothetical protein
MKDCGSLVHPVSLVVCLLDGQKSKLLWYRQRINAFRFNQPWFPQALFFSFFGSLKKERKKVAEINNGPILVGSLIWPGCYCGEGLRFPGLS